MKLVECYSILVPENARLEIESIFLIGLIANLAHPKGPQTLSTQYWHMDILQTSVKMLLKANLQARRKKDEDIQGC